MAIRKSVEDTVVVDGARDQWIARCTKALESGGFRDVKVNPTLNQIEGAYRSFFAWGDIAVTLLPEGDRTRIVAKATANVDNVWALFMSPTKKILTAFKDNLG